MKKKILMITAIASFIIVGMFAFIPKAEAQEEINPDCPNGCLDWEGTCWCYTFYDYIEYIWPE